jgi:predicted phage-related endonuclease
VQEASEFVSTSQRFLDEAETFQDKKPTSDLLEPTSDILALHRELKAAERELFQVETRIEVLQSRLKIAIGENLGCRGVASWKWQETWKLDQAMLKRDKPELYEQYCKMSGYRVFRLE